MEMKDLVNFLFDYVDPGKDKIHQSFNIDGAINKAEDAFYINMDLSEEYKGKLHRAIVGNFYVLQMKIKNRRFYEFCSFYGDPSFLITDEVILDQKIVDGNVALITPSPYSVVEEGFTRESFQLFIESMYQKNKVSQKSMEETEALIERLDHVVGYFIYRDMNKESQILDLTDKVYSFTEEKERVFIKHIIKDEYSDNFLCVGYHYEEYEVDGKTKKKRIMHNFVIDKDYNLVKNINRQVRELLGHNDFTITSTNYDIFAINLTKENKTHIYSQTYNRILNTFDLPNVDIVNILGTDPNKYGTQSLILLYYYSMVKNEDLLMFAKLVPEDEESAGKFFNIPNEDRRIIKHIRGTDILYTVVETNDEDKPYLFTIMYIDEKSNELVAEYIKTSSVPVTIWVSKETGVITFLYRTENINQIVHFWKDYGTTYKYSHIDLKVEPLLEDKESVYEGLERLKKHLLETNPDKLAMDEWEIMHYFVDISYKGIKNSDLITSTLTDPDPMIESDYYVNVNTGEVNTDIAKVFTSIYGNFMDFLLVDGSIGHRLRKVSNFDIQKWIKEREEDEAWLREKLSEQKN